MFFLAALYVGVGLLLIALTIPLIQWRIKPNHFYGFRAPKAFKNEAVWYEINAYSGKRLAVAGAVIVLAAIVFALVPGMDVGVYVGIITVILLLALGIGLIQSFLYLNQIAK